MTLVIDVKLYVLCDARTVILGIFCNVIKRQCTRNELRCLRCGIPIEDNC